MHICTHDHISVMCIKNIFTSIALIQPRKKQLSSGTVPHHYCQGGFCHGPIRFNHLPFG